MDPRTNRNVEYDEFMEHFVKAGLVQATDEDEVKALLKEVHPIIDRMEFESFQAEEDMYPHLCKLFNSVIDFIRRRDPEGVAPDLHARVTSQHGEGVSIHDTKVDLSFYDMARTPHGTLSTDSQAKRATKSATPNPVSPLTSASTGSPPGTIDLDEPQHDSPSSTSISQSQPSLQSGPSSSFDSMPSDEPQASTGSNRKPLPSVEENLIARCLWDFIRMFVEVKFSVDPYSFARGSTDRFSESKDAEYSRGQIAEYAGECLKSPPVSIANSFTASPEAGEAAVFSRDALMLRLRVCSICIGPSLLKSDKSNTLLLLLSLPLDPQVSFYANFCAQF
ncbi:hypothetical protein K474DRAFT_1678591 [Panus rudis PR-1116 ss-1]|nr:hypothetical protein K474DRAFT_1678591 [Panus rudis PR-1116 ss-1]